MIHDVLLLGHFISPEIVFDTFFLKSIDNLFDSSGLWILTEGHNRRPDSLGPLDPVTDDLENLVPHKHVVALLRILEWLTFLDPDPPVRVLWFS